MPEPISDPSERRAARTLHDGVVRGGPLDGKRMTSRFPRGAVAISPDSSRAWVYDFNPDSPHERAHFVAREIEGRELDGEKHLEAVDGGDYDVWAV